MSPKPLLLLSVLLFFSLVILAQQGTLDNSFASGGRLIRSIGLQTTYLGPVLQQTDGKIIVTGSSHFQSPTLDFFIARFNANGTPDNTFDVDGIVNTDVNAGSNDYLYDAILLSSGKILLASIEPAPVLLRYNSNGSLDNTFDGDGKLFITGFNDLLLTRVIEQPDGKILLGGTLGNSPSFIIMRLTAQGQLDNTFDGDGIATVSVSPGLMSYAAFRLQPADNKIVIAGTVNNASKTFVTVRLNTNGSIDNTFGGTGFVYTDAGSSNNKSLHNVIIQNNGSIILSGSGRDINSMFTTYTLLLKYNTNGTLDNSFDGDGILQINKSHNFYTEGFFLVSLADDKILLPGIYKSSSGVQGLALYKLNANGSVDNSFGNNGIVQTPLVSNNPEESFSIMIQSDGKIVRSAYISDGTHFKPSLYRMLSTGAPDNTFDSDGFLLMNITTMPSFDSGMGISVRNNDYFVTTGNYSDGYVYSSFVSRFTPNGTLDPSFGVNGNIFLQNPSFVHVNSVAHQSDGKIVITGTEFDVWDGNRAFVFRYNENGTPDNSFGNNGRVFITIDNNEWQTSLDIGLQSDGKIIFTVQFLNNEGTQLNFLYRLNTNGIVDNTFGSAGRILLDFSLPLLGDYDISYPYKHLAILPDNKILVLGNTVSSNYAVRRFTSNGAIDNSFNGGQLLTGRFSGFDCYVGSIALQSDGKIVITGAEYVSGLNRIGISRHLADGTKDNTFNGNGSAILSGINGQQYPASVHVQPDNKIIIGGTNENGGFFNMLVVKLNENGSLDNSFGSTGFFNIPPPSNSNVDQAFSMALQSNGKILLCGITSVLNSDGDFAVYRINNDVATSISNRIRELKNITVVPNPVKSQLLITSNNIVPGKYTITVRSAAGKQLFTETITTNGNNLQYKCMAQHWPVGVLFVEIKGQEQQKTFRILKIEN